MSLFKDAFKQSLAKKANKKKLSDAELRSALKSQVVSEEENPQESTNSGKKYKFFAPNSNKSKTKSLDFSLPKEDLASDEKLAQLASTFGGQKKQASKKNSSTNSTTNKTTVTVKKEKKNRALSIASDASVAPATSRESSTLKPSTTEPLFKDLDHKAEAFNQAFLANSPLATKKESKPKASISPQPQTKDSKELESSKTPLQQNTSKQKQHKALATEKKSSSKAPGNKQLLANSNSISKLKSSAKTKSKSTQTSQNKTQVNKKPNNSQKPPSAQHNKKERTVNKLFYTLTEELLTTISSDFADYPQNIKNRACKEALATLVSQVFINSKNIKTLAQLYQESKKATSSLAKADSKEVLASEPSAITEYNKASKKNSQTTNKSKLLDLEHSSLAELQPLLAALEQTLLKAQQQQAWRLAAIPQTINYNEDLPVAQQIDKIRQLLVKHQCLVVAGDTGSGKTTQIPKLCLELGFSNSGLIGHTQPRRIAATSVADRLAKELETSTGTLVGYKVRFNDRLSEQTHIKLMTDGILLAELSTDPLLKQYSCLIIDEAHERSLNNDFILGYLKQILSSRPDLKIIITSATIDVERFSKHFNNCPIVKVEGRTFPVEVRYRPLSLENFATDYDYDDKEELNSPAELSFGRVNNSLGASLGKKAQEFNEKFKGFHKEKASPQVEQAKDNSNLLESNPPTVKSAKHGNLAKGETFNLPTSNPYAESTLYSGGEESNVISKRTFGRSVRGETPSKKAFLKAQEKQNSLPQNYSLDSSITPKQDQKPSREELYLAQQAKEKQEHISTYGSLTQEAKDLLNNNEVLKELAHLSEDALLQEEDNTSYLPSSKVDPHQDRKAHKAYSAYAQAFGSDSLELHQGVIAACEELLKEEQGDILVFLSGEREIHDVAQELSTHFSKVNRRYPSLKVLPLYGRLSSSDQQLIFKPDGSLRIILATNIAETSLTVPGIKYVIDAGTARISRFNYKTQVQGLPIEAISQASANQRKGRCGRTSPGICIRLYSEEDFNLRPEFTEPEIRRTNLSAVILKMLSLGLSDLAHFPFLDAPDSRYIRNGLKLLEQLGAIKSSPSNSEQYKVTAIGKALSQLPLDPRLGRMILAASDNGSLNEMLIITSGLTIVDVRERPTGKQMQASQLHAEYKDKSSDYSSLLNLWQFLHQEPRSQNQLRKLCRQRYLNYLRVREWEDLYQQLRLVAISLKLKFNQVEAGYTEIHQAMIPGLLDHIATLDSQEAYQYKGARNRTFRFFPVSALAKQRHSWVIASEIINLSQVYALRGAKIDVSWVEKYAQHLLKYSYNSPHWSKKRGEVVASMSASLFGLTIIENRIVSYSQVDPELCHQLFIRQALVEQNWDAPYRFYHHNNKVITEALKVEEQQRKRGLIISEEDLFQWYQSKIPKHIYNSASFKQWWTKKEKTAPNYLDIDFEEVIEETELETYPEYISDGLLQLKLNYVFDPNKKDDGVNVLVPLQYLANLDYRLYQWHIVNYRQEMVEELIRSLPKHLRKQLIPAPNYAQVFTDRVPEVIRDNDKALSIFSVLSQLYRDVNGAYIEAEEWAQAYQNLPPHLKIHFKILDLNGDILEVGDNLQELQQKLLKKSQEIVNQASIASYEQATVYTTWDLGTFGGKEQIARNKVLLDTYPALVPVNSLEGEAKKAISKPLEKVLREGNFSKDLLPIASGCIVQNFSTASEQQRAMHKGIRDLLLLNSESPIKFLQDKLPNRAKLAMYFSGNVQQIIAECILCAADHIMAHYHQEAQKASLAAHKLALSKENLDNFIWDEHYFLYLLDKMRGEINGQTYKVAQIVETILVKANDIKKAIKKHKDLSLMLALNDMKEQVASLTAENFVAKHNLEELMQVPRYLDAILYRLDKMGQNPNVDQKFQREVNELEEIYKDLVSNWPSYRDPKVLDQLFFQIQELRVSLFAQILGTKITVSYKRILNFIEQIKENQL